MPLPSPDTGLSAYLRDIRRYPLLSAEEERRLAYRWQESGDSAAFEQLIGSHLRLVVGLAKKARGYGLQTADLIAEGNIGLIEAARRFDPDRGNRFSTYAIWWIRAAIQHYVLDNASVVRLGTTAGQKKLFFNLSRLKGELGEFDDDNISSDVVISIAERLGVRADEVIDMNGRLARGDYSLNVPVTQQGETNWQDLLADESVDMEAEIADDDRAVIMDFEGLQFLGSAGLRVIFMIASELQKRDVGFALCAPPKPIAKVIRLSGMEKVIPVHPSRADALHAL